MRKLLAHASRGAISGLAGTATMSLLMLAARRFGLLGEPPPRRLTRLLLSPLGALSPRGRTLDSAATLAHFAFGGAMGGLFGLSPLRPSLARGVLFGLGVWAVNYAGVLPRLGLMPPARRDRPGRPTSMLLAHALYGATLAGCERALAARASETAP
jgi:hypothetical protein